MAKARRAHALERLHAVEDLTVERRRVAAREAGRLRVDRDHEHPLAVEAGVERPEVSKRPDEKPGRNQDQQRERHLTRDEELAGPKRPPPGHTATVLEGGREIEAHGPERGREPEQEPRYERERRGEGEDAGVGSDVEGRDR